MSDQIIAGKYKVIKELGSGGMGFVYEGIDTRLQRPVAIKALHPHLTGDPAFLKRFQREARTMARLDHAHIIRVFDVFEEDNRHYIVMEFFSGRDLRQVLSEKGRFSPQDAIPMILHVAQAMAYAHQQGVIHRDIKPGNIMVNALGQTKIMDFGIATAIDEASLTPTGDSIGTPKYMSPEQARGDKMDGRSDLFSLGMVFYEMLTGKTPYEGLPSTALIGKLLDREELPLSFQSNVPIPLQDMIRWMLKKNPEKRIANASTLADWIKVHEATLFNPSTVSVDQDETEEVPSRQTGQSVARRNRWIPSLAMAATVLILTGIVIAILTKKNEIPLLPEKTQMETTALPTSPSPPSLPLKGRDNEVQDPVLNKPEVQITEAIKPVKEEQKKKPPTPKPEVNASVPPSPLPPPEIVRENIPPIPIVSAPLPSGPSDLAQIQNILGTFRSAYQNRDLSSLKEVSQMSERRQRFLQQLFLNYTQIQVSITEPKIEGDRAGVIISINQLTGTDGNPAFPSAAWRETAATLKKEEGKWGKVIW